MYGYQFHNMQEVAKNNNWTLFSVMQNHYNLLYREDEHEMIPICQQYAVSLPIPDEAPVIKIVFIILFSLF